MGGQLSTPSQNWLERVNEWKLWKSNSISDYCFWLCQTHALYLWEENYMSFNLMLGTPPTKNNNFFLGKIQTLGSSGVFSHFRASAFLKSSTYILAWLKWGPSIGLLKWDARDFGILPFSIQDFMITASMKTRWTRTVSGLWWGSGNRAGNTLPATHTLS